MRKITVTPLMVILEVLLTLAALIAIKVIWG